MWKVATSLGPGAAVTAAEHALPKAEKFIFYGRYIALGASVAYVLLGGLLIGIRAPKIYAFILGPILMSMGLFTAILEYPFVPLAKYKAFNFFCNYMFRAGLYVAFIIPSFFNIITFVAGLILLGAAVCYGYAHYKDAKGTEVTEPVPQDVEANQQQQQKGKQQQQPQQQQQQQQPQQQGRAQKGKSGKPVPEISEEAPMPSSKSKKSKKTKKFSKFSLSSQAAAPGEEEDN